MKGTNLKGDRPTYVEDGCSLCDSCFLCRFRPDCIIKSRDVLKTPKAEAKAQQLYQAEQTLEQIAEALSQPVRTIERWINNAN